jgi:hypothetical protein
VESSKLLSVSTERRTKIRTEDGIGTISMTRGDLIDFGSSTNSNKEFYGFIYKALE